MANAENPEDPSSERFLSAKLNAWMKNLFILGASQGEKALQQGEILPATPTLQREFARLQPGSGLKGYLARNFWQCLDKTLTPDGKKTLMIVSPKELRQAQQILLELRPDRKEEQELLAFQPGYLYDPQTVVLLRENTLRGLLERGRRIDETETNHLTHPLDNAALRSLQYLAMMPGQTDSRLQAGADQITLAEYMAALQSVRLDYEETAPRFHHSFNLYDGDLLAGLMSLSHLLGASRAQEEVLAGIDPQLNGIRMMEHLIKGYSITMSLPPGHKRRGRGWLGETAPVYKVGQLPRSLN